MVHLDAEAFPDLSGAERAAAVRHLAACAACRHALAEDFPEALFSLLSLEPVPEADLAAVSAAVVRSLPEGRGSWVEALRERGLPRGAVAAATAAAALVFVVWASRPAPAPEPVASLPVVPRAGVALVEPATQASVVDLTVGETQVVMIFDPEMRL